MKLFCMIGWSLVLMNFSYAQKPWITFYANTFDINATSDHDTISIPFKLDKDVSLSDVKVNYSQAIYIRLEKKYDKKYLDGFTILAVDPKAIPAFQIAVDLRIIRTAGIYELYISFSNGKETQESAFSLTRPPAKLEAPQTVHIDIVGNDIVKQEPLIIRETGGQSAARALALPMPFFSGTSAKNPVVFNPDVCTIGADGVFSADYTLPQSVGDDLSLGKTTGKMEITSRELAAPLVVNVEIMNRRSSWWIILLLFSGILVGFVVRTFLKNAKDLSEQKVMATDLLNKIKTETAPIQDEDFKAEINTITADLDAEVRKKAVVGMIALTTSLATLIAKTTDEYNDRKKKFEEKLKGIKDKLDSIAILFAANNLSEVINKGLASAGTYYHGAMSALVEANAKSAGGKTTAMLQEAATFLKEYAESVTDLASVIAGDKIFPVVTPEPVKTVTKQINERVVNEIKQLKTAPDAGELVSTIYTADSIQRNVERMLVFVREKLTTIFNADYKHDGSALQEGFKNSFASWDSFLQNELDDPTTTPDYTMIPVLDNLWGKVRAAKPAVESRLGNPSAVAADVISIFPWLKTNPHEGGVRTMDLDFRMDSIAVVAESARKGLILYSIVQSLLLFLIMALAAYKFYAPEFIGRPDEMVAIFLFAFGLDITVDSVLLLRDKKT